MADTYSNLDDYTHPDSKARTSTPGPVLVLLGFVPLTISYLAHVSDTKTLRLGVWGLGVLCWMWALPTIDIDPSELVEWFRPLDLSHSDGPLIKQLQIFG